MAIEGFDGTLLDTLVVKIDVDLSGFRRGIAEAIREVGALKMAIVGNVGGVTLSDALTAALVAPLAVASARIGQVRNEMRLLSTELRAAAALAGPRPGGAGALVPYVAGGMLLDATLGNQARGAGGRFERGASYRGIESDDLSAAARVSRQAPEGMRFEPRHEGGAYIPIGGFWDRHYGEIDERGQPARSMSEARERGDPEPRRRRNWFERTFSPTHAQRAFQTGQREFPGFAEAADNLGAGAHRVGAGGRRAIGSGIARALGLVGLGALLGDLIALAASLATVISGTLAGAFAALLTPIGAVVGALAVLVGLFAAANWDNFKKFGEWVGERFVKVVGPAWEHLMGALGEAWQALVELFEAAGLKEQMQELWTVLEPILQGLVELVLRVAAAILEALTGIVRVFTQVVRTITALIRGDWEAAWEAAIGIVESLFGGIVNIVAALLPEIEGKLREIAAAVGTWIGDTLTAVINNGAAALQRFGQAFVDVWNTITGRTGAGLAANDDRIETRILKSRYEPGKGGSLFSPPSKGTSAEAQKMLEAEAIQRADSRRGLERLEAAAQDAGQALVNAFEAAAFSGARLSDVLKNLLKDLAAIVARRTIIEPLAEWLSGMVRGVFSGGGSKKGGDSAGSLASILANTFAGGFAEGGFIGPGQWGIVGERGKEYVFGGKTGKTIVPANDGGFVVDARAYIDARGADPAAIARLEARLAQRESELGLRIRAEVGNMRTRGYL